VIVVLTCLTYDAAILPQFVEHYARLGADAVHVAVLELTEGVLEKAQSLTSNSSMPVMYHKVGQRWQDSRIEGVVKTELRSSLKMLRSDWYVPADLDEFVDFDCDLPNLARQCVSSDYVMGQFIDRVSMYGELTEYDPTRNIEDQYPIPCSIVRDLMGLDDRKVVFCRGCYSVSAGHHRIIDESRKKFEREFRIDHYAWRKGKIEQLKARVDNYRHLHDKGNFAPFERFFRHIKNNDGRLNVSVLEEL
jgi:hypothetical protein